MAYPADAPDVRSHRRRPAQRIRVPPSIIARSSSCSSAGPAVRVTRSSDDCNGNVTAKIIASPKPRRCSQSVPDLDERHVAGRCAPREVAAPDIAVMAQELGTDWDIKSGGLAPDVWVPDSTAWVRRASIAATPSG